MIWRHPYFWTHPYGIGNDVSDGCAGIGRLYQQLLHIWTELPCSSICWHPWQKMWRWPMRFWKLKGREKRGDCDSRKKPWTWDCIMLGQLIDVFFGFDAHLICWKKISSLTQLKIFPLWSGGDWHIFVVPILGSRPLFLETRCGVGPGFVAENLPPVDHRFPHRWGCVDPSVAKSGGSPLLLSVFLVEVMCSTWGHNSSIATGVLVKN